MSFRTRSPAAESYWKSLFDSAPVPAAHLEAVHGPDGGIVDFMFRTVNPPGSTASWPGKAAVEGDRSLSAAPDVGDEGLPLVEACRDVVRTRRRYAVRGVPLSNWPGDPGKDDAHLDLFASCLDEGVVLVWVVTTVAELGSWWSTEGSGEARLLRKQLETMRHELGNVLNSMLGFCDLLESEVSGPLNDRQKEHIGRVHRAGRHLSSLVEDSVASLHAVEGGARLRREDVDVKQLVGDVVAMMLPEAEREGLELRSSCPQPAPTVRTDGDKLRQILSNLIGNALKYTKEGAVRVEVDVPDDEALCIRVRDSGPGIPSDRRDEIFDPYVRLDTGSANERSGSGLGLSLCRYLAQRLGGMVELESSVSGEGSVFLVRVPLRAAEAVSSENATAS